LAASWRRPSSISQCFKPGQEESDKTVRTGNQKRRRKIMLEKGVYFIWIAIISSSIALIGYSIWNFFVVLFDLTRIGREAQAQKR
jgi:hypothetical protein